MPAIKQPLDTLQDIKQMMERSSRFISLSGLSGVAAGICALVGAWFALSIIHQATGRHTIPDAGFKVSNHASDTLQNHMGRQLFIVALVTFFSAFVLAFIFTYLRSKKNNTPIWGSSARRLMLNVSIPMLVGGIYLLKLVELGSYGMIAPGCLIFYGLALVNAGKYTFGEVKYLGYSQILLGLINCWFIGFGLYFWATGFGFLHILYGFIMWYKYERNT